MSATIIRFPICDRCGRAGETLPCGECLAELCTDCSLPHKDAHVETAYD